MSEDMAALHAKRRALMPWLWTATVFAMLTSLGEGTTLMMSLGSAWYVAVLFPLASDVGLIAALRGAAALSESGRDVRAARPLRWFASLFCLSLNVGGSILAGHWVAAMFHAGIPALVIALATFEERYAAEFSALIREQRDTDRWTAERIAREAAEREAKQEAAKRAEFEALKTNEAAKTASVEATARKRKTAAERIPRRTDDELITQVRELIAAAPEGRVSRRKVQDACRVSPERAARLLKAIAAEAVPATDAPSAYL